MFSITIPEVSTCAPMYAVERKCAQGLVAQLLASLARTFVDGCTMGASVRASQDVLQELAHTVEREEGRNAEEESRAEVGKQGEERAGDSREEHTDGEVREPVVQAVAGEEEGEREKEEPGVADGVCDEEGGREGRTAGSRAEDEAEVAVGGSALTSPPPPPSRASQQSS